MSMTVTIDKRELLAFQKRIHGDADQAIRTLALMLVSDAKQLAPFEIGNLRASIKNRDMGYAHQWVHDEMEYGIYQELGFTHPYSGKFIQNPFMVPATERVRRHVRRVFEGEINR